MTSPPRESARSQPGPGRIFGRGRRRWAGLALGCAAILLPARGVGFAGARVIAGNGYTGCIELRNDSTRVVLEPNLGGRVLHYQLGGVEVLHQDEAYDGATQASLDRPVPPPGGRFDIGPEFLQPRHPVLWTGRWRAEITGDRSARMTSEIDPATGLQLMRDFRLDASSSHLTCTQTIFNRGESRRAVCHWGRTFAEGGGICVAPLNPASRYPAGYVTYDPKGSIIFKPAPESNVVVRDGLLAIIGPAARRKFAIDVSEGWLAYLTRRDVLFVKRFPVYPDRRYGEIAGNAASVWYDGDQKCEIEPIGPLEQLAPGQRAEFTEDWWLHDFAFPGDRRIDVAAVRRVVAASVPAGGEDGK